MASPTIRLNDGTSMPWLAFGSGSKLRGTDASKQITDAITAGFRHIDTAQMYGNEESVGQGIIDSGIPREELYVTTKLDKPLPGLSVKSTLKTSLAKLQTDYVDLFLIHVPIVHSDLKAVWKEMEACKAEGLARSIGVSNFLPEHFEQILDDARVLPAVNQIELHPYVFKATQPTIKYMKERGIIATSYGGLTPIARCSGGPIDPVLAAIADRLSAARASPVTMGQVLQVWLRKKGVPYVTTTSKDRMTEYLDSIHVPVMTDDEERQIEEAGSKLHYRVVCTWMDTNI